MLPPPSQVLFGESCSRTAFSRSRSQCLAGSTSGLFCSSLPSSTQVRRRGNRKGPRRLTRSPPPISLFQVQSTDTFFPSFFQRISAAALPRLATWGPRSSAGNWGLKDHGAHRVEVAALSKGPSPVPCPGLCLSQSSGVQGCSSCPQQKCSWTNTCSSCRGMLRL